MKVLHVHNPLTFYSRRPAGGGGALRSAGGGGGGVHDPLSPPRVLLGAVHAETRSSRRRGAWEGGGCVTDTCDSQERFQEGRCERAGTES